jgi:hypothetical protein
MADNRSKPDKKSVAKGDDRRFFKKGANPMTQNMFENFDLSYKSIDQPQADSNACCQLDFCLSKKESNDKNLTEEIDTNAA